MSVNGYVADRHLAKHRSQKHTYAHPSVHNVANGIYFAYNLFEPEFVSLVGYDEQVLVVHFFAGRAGHRLLTWQEPINLNANQELKLW